MDDVISRKQAIKTAIEVVDEWDGGYSLERESMIEKAFAGLPSAQPEYKELQDWKTDFKGFIDALDMPRDDYCGIMEYIDEVPSAQPETHEERTGTHACDLISRKDAIDAVKELCLHYTPTKSVYHPHMDFVIEELMNLPSAHQERKKGKWILTEDDNYEYCTCSECGYQNGENWMNGSDIPFCANCGADMRGGKNE